MHRLISSVFGYLFFGTVLFAQQAPCGTDVNDLPSTAAFMAQHRSSFTSVQQTGVPIDIPVKIHIIAAVNGAFAIDSSEVFDELEIVNNAFSSIDLRFVSCGPINYIFDNQYLTFIKGESEDLCDIHDQPGAINIYFVREIQRQDGSTLCGYAYDFDYKNRVIMDNSCAVNGSTLTHELGHSFSLYHTHETDFGLELVDGSNCATSGDLLCDTPADPQLDSDTVGADCVYNDDAVDANNQVYTPATDNLMSYSRKACRDVFTEEQLTQMLAFYQFEGGVLDCLTSGPTTTRSLQQLEVTIYPNPTSGQVYLSQIPAEARLVLVDLAGKTCWQTTLNTATSLYPLTFLEQLPTGSYFLHIATPTATAIQQINKY